jgi:hypothetical protein
MTERENRSGGEERSVVGHLVEAFDDDVEAVTTGLSEGVMKHAGVVERQRPQPFDSDSGHPVLVSPPLKSGRPMGHFESAGGQSSEDFVDVGLGPAGFGMVGISLI